MLPAGFCASAARLKAGKEKQPPAQAPYLALLPHTQLAAQQAKQAAAAQTHRQQASPRSCRQQSLPVPSSAILCPGSTETTTVSSGIERKTEGKNAKTICAAKTATMRSANASAGMESVANTEAIVLECIPGMSPEKIPRRIPAT